MQLNNCLSQIGIKNIQMSAMQQKLDMISLPNKET